MKKTLSLESVVAATRCWVQRVVINLNLCPFARREFEGGRLRFVVSNASAEGALLSDLASELQRLDSDASIETTLLIHPGVLNDFARFNQFLDRCDQLLEEREWTGYFQVASFHPDYRFAGTDADDAENYSNRSPYPMLHLLREDSVTRAVAGHPDVDGIPVRNIELLNRMGTERLRGLWGECFDE
jgi:hypothetical protein